MHYRHKELIDETREFQQLDKLSKPDVLALALAMDDQPVRKEVVVKLVHFT
jgi:hypothetical protein